jgi:hypothetical protein
LGRKEVIFEVFSIFRIFGEPYHTLEVDIFPGKWPKSGNSGQKQVKYALPKSSKIVCKTMDLMRESIRNMYTTSQHTKRSHNVRNT